jgi:hypothetical protein
MNYPKLLVVLFVCGIPAWAQTFVTTDQNLLGYVSVDSSQNLLPDSAFTPGNICAGCAGNSLAYWAVLYPAPLSTGWTTSANQLVYTGTGSPSGATDAESPIFAIPYSSNSYNLVLQLSANLTNQSGGGNVVAAELYPAVGQVSPLPPTAYCIITFASGVNATKSTTCSVPGNVGTLLLLIGLNGATVPSGQTITFTQPQVNFGTTPAAYQATVGYNQILAQAAPAYPGGSGGGPVLWPILQSYITQEAGGTLAATNCTNCQNPVVLTTSFQQLLSSVSSAPTFNFGCSSATTGPTVGQCEHLPGLPTTSFYTMHGLAEVQCTGVTAPAPITAGLATLSVSSGGGWVSIMQDGVSGYSLTPSLGDGTYLFPLLSIVSADPVNADYGEFDIQMKVGSLAPSGACKAVAASLDVRVVPTGSTVAGSPVFQNYGDRSHLVH